ncbi:MAG: hypothetical protein AAFN81_08535 [Bacteroidota bacterium]
MQQSKLIDLMRKLSKAQVRYFERLLPALVPTQNNEIQRLYQFLARFAPKYSSPNLSREKVQASLNWKPKQLTDRSSQLLQLLGQCLVIEQVMQNPTEQQLRLMNIFAGLGLDKHYQSAKRQAQRSLDVQKQRGPTHLLQTYRLHQLEALAQETYQRRHKPSLQLATDALDTFYLATKLGYLLEMTSAGQVLDIPYDLRLTAAVKEWARQAPFANHALIALYRTTLQLIEKPQEEESFSELQDLLIKHRKDIPEVILKNLYTYLLNYCTKKITQDHDTHYYEHYLNINTKLIDEGLILENGRLLPWRFSNLITVSLRTGRLEWARQFLERYRTYLPPEDNENTYNYNLANCLYYEGQPDDALLLLLQLDLRDPLLAIAAKNLTVKIHWETDQTELLLTFLENYRLYIYRQQLAKAHLKQQVKRFIDFTRRMAKIPAFAPEKFADLLEKLPAAGEIMEYDWLRAQVQDALRRK